MINSDEEIDKILGVSEYKEIDGSEHILNDDDRSNKDIQIRFKGDNTDGTQRDTTSNNNTKLFSSIENSKPFHTEIIIQSEELDNNDKRLNEYNRPIYSKQNHELFAQDSFDYNDKERKEPLISISQEKNNNNSCAFSPNNRFNSVNFGRVEGNDFGVADSHEYNFFKNSSREYSYKQSENNSRKSDSFDLETLLGLDNTRMAEKSPSKNEMNNSLFSRKNNIEQLKDSYGFPDNQISSKSPQYITTIGNQRTHEIQNINSNRSYLTAMGNDKRDDIVRSNEKTSVSDFGYSCRDSLFSISDGEYRNDSHTLKQENMYVDNTANHFDHRNQVFGDCSIDSQSNLKAQTPFSVNRNGLYDSNLTESLSGYERYVNRNENSQYMSQSLYGGDYLKGNSEGQGPGPTLFSNLKKEKNQELSTNNNDPLLFRNPVFFQYNFNPNAYNRIKRRRRLNSNTYIHTGGKVMHPSQLSSIDYVFGNLNSMTPVSDTGDSFESRVNMISPERNRNETKRSFENFKRKLNAIDFDNITVLELKSLMKNFGVNPNGKKHEMIERLQQKLKELDPSSDTPAQFSRSKENGSFDGFFF